MRLPYKILVFSIVFIYMSNMPLFIFAMGATAFKPLYWYFVVIMLAILVVVLNPSILAGKKSKSSIIFFGLLLFSFHTFLGFLYSSHSQIAEQVLITRLEVIILFFSFIIILLHLKGAFRCVQLAILVTAILAIIMNLVDFFDPIWSTVSGRAAGLYLNPNLSGKALVFLMVAGIPLVPARFRILFCAIVGVGVLVTFSRSSWMLWGVAILGLIIAGYLASGSKKLLFLFGFLAIILIVYNMGVFASLFIQNSWLLDYLTPNTQARLGLLQEAFTDNSAQIRFYLAKEAWNMFQERPLLGFGLGFTHEWGYSLSTHNMYLSVLVETGLVGLMVFSGFLAIIWHHADHIGKVILILFIFSSFSTHNNLDQPAMIMMLAFAAVFHTSKEKSS